MTTKRDTDTAGGRAGRPAGEAAGAYDDGRLRVEHDNYYVSCDGRALRLPRKEFLILSRLARTPQRTVTAADIWRHAWPPSAPLNAESLHVHIYRLRRRLSPRLARIETMVNVGYRLVTAAEGGGRAGE